MSNFSTLLYSVVYIFYLMFKRNVARVSTKYFIVNIVLSQMERVVGRRERLENRKIKSSSTKNCNFKIHHSTYCQVFYKECFNNVK